MRMKESREVVIYIRKAGGGAKVAGVMLVTALVRVHRLVAGRANKGRGSNALPSNIKRNQRSFWNPSKASRQVTFPGGRWFLFNFPFVPLLRKCGSRTVDHVSLDEC